MNDIGARIMVAPMAGLWVEQTFRGSRVGDIYLTCSNLEANQETSCAPLVLRAVGCGSFYPESLWAAWLRLMYAVNDKKPPRLMLREKHKLEPLPLDVVVRQHDDDAKPDYLNIRREDHGYRLWMDSLWPFGYQPEGGILLKPEHLNAAAWAELEKIASLLHHPDFIARSDEMMRRAREINHIPENIAELLQQDREKSLRKE